jgi:8-oxo-dGTP pyrophosphatase MutT (NUDIX family)
MREGRWTTVTPSQFAPEREALDHVRQLLPDAEPYRAWSSFTFTAHTGHVHEVDLLVAARSGIYLIEVKSLHGKLTSSGPNWILTNRHTRTFDNPLHLADAKAKPLLRNERDEWELPGGKLEVGESPEHSVCREVAEELGLTITSVDIVDSWVYEITPARHVFIVSYGSRYTGDEDPIHSDEHKELGLFAYQEIAGLHLPDPYKTTINRWRQRISAGG